VKCPFSSVITTQNQTRWNLRGLIEAALANSKTTIPTQIQGS